MRITLFLLCLSLLSGMAAESYSQSTRLTITMQNATIENVLREIENQSEFRFFYNGKIDVDKQVSVEFNKRRITDVLDHIFAETSITYEVVGRQIVLSGNKNLILQQAMSVSGLVIDPSGLPLPGVTVVIKGTTQGTITNPDGNYKLNDVPSTGVLVFSFVGMKTQEINVNGRSIIDVTLAEESIGLEEVVAVGYGTMKRSDLSGSVASIETEHIEKSSPSTINSALQGRASGVQVSSSNAGPGGGVNIRIRGTSSIFSGAEPLYVIDGFPIYSSNSAADPAGGLVGGNNLRSSPNALSMINPSDIKSIEILKDASATAIYGSRGANGVVLITTKRGTKAGKNQIEFETYYGLQKLDNKIEMMNAQEYIEMANEAFEKSGLDPYFDGSSPDRPLASQAETTDWQDEIYRVAPMKNYNLSFVGGDKDTQYMVSGNYFDQDGIMITSQFERASMRVSLDQKMSDRFTVGTNVNISRTVNQRAPTDAIEGKNMVQQALTEAPWFKPVNEDGSFNIDPLRDVPVDNPVVLLQETSDETTTRRVLANVYTDYAILKNLKLRVQGGTDFLFGERHTYQNRGLILTTNIDGRASINQSIMNTYLLNAVLSYDAKLAEKHNLTALAGYEIQAQNRETRSMRSQGFSSDDQKTLNLGEGLQQIGVGTYKNRWQSVGYFSRINYNYDNKLLLTFNARLDGSSKFGADNKWGFFPSGAIAYRMTEIPAIKNLNIFDNFKLRTSYGATGNSEIGIYLSQGTWKISGKQYSFDNELANGAYLNRLENPDLKWETTYQFDIGADFGFLANRLHATFDYFHKKTVDLIMPVSIPYTTGFSSATQNVGTLVNKGFEFSVGGVPVNKQITWDVNANFSIFRSEPTDLGVDEEITIASFGRYGGRHLEVGKPAGLIGGMYVEGVFANAEEAANAPSNLTKDNEAGEYRYRDIDGDGKITSNDATFIGNAQPDLVFGITNDLSYKNFNLNFLLQGTYGNEILCTYPGISTDGLSNARKDVATERWTTTNTDAKYTRADKVYGGHGFATNSAAVSDGSYVRLRSLTLSYTLDSHSQRWPKVQLYVTGQNLFTITNYIGYNPDVSSQGERAFGEGYDAGSYPLAKSYLLGVKLSF